MWKRKEQTKQSREEKIEKAQKGEQRKDIDRQTYNGRHCSNLVQHTVGPLIFNQQGWR